MKKLATCFALVFGFGASAAQAGPVTLYLSGSGTLYSPYTQPPVKKPGVWGATVQLNDAAAAALFIGGTYGWNYNDPQSCNPFARECPSGSVSYTSIFNDGVGTFFVDQVERGGFQFSNGVLTGGMGQNYAWGVSQTGYYEF